jgi:hypothetical protein
MMPLLEPTLTGIVEMIGPLPQHHDAHGEDLYPTLHLDRGYDSGRPATCWRCWASTVRSRS